MKKGDIRNWNPVASEIVPNPSEIYRRQNEVFRGIYERTKDLMRKLDPRVCRPGQGAEPGS